MREQALFSSLDIRRQQRVRKRELVARLTQAGIEAEDPRLTESMTALLDPSQAPDALDQEMDRGHFHAKIHPNIGLIERALQGKLIIPDFQHFSLEIEQLYAQVRENRDGKPADYIPQLDLTEPAVDQFAVGVCTVDGQRHTSGDSDAFFSVQSTCKPINYCLAFEEHGPEVVHGAIGHEPSGAFFNELTLDQKKRPHNPMINAGAIISSSLIGLKDKRAALTGGNGCAFDHRSWAGQRFDHVMARWQAACGGTRPRFGTSVYLSERETADRNFALAYYMREQGAFDPDVDLHDVLDFYFQSCSIEVNARIMAVVAGTLANGGICPVTGERVFRTDTVRNCLSLMSSCGMYNFSGEFAFTIGLPAKSSVSGALLVVVPNVMGFCVWSPRLDQFGNSVRGIEFCRRLVERFSFHNYDSLTGASGKRDPRLSRVQLRSRITDMIWAASKGDVRALQERLTRGATLSCADYDRRTPLHLAAAEGQTEIVHFHLEHKRKNDGAVDLNPRDRWGGTPVDDALLHGHEGLAALLTAAGGVPGRGALPMRPKSSNNTAPKTDDHKTTEVIWAAGLGDMTAIYRLVAQGVPLDTADYDLRTPLHLAASEGHLEVVEYLITQGVDPEPRDRWGGTPLIDAQRHSHTDVVRYFRAQRNVQAATRKRMAAPPPDSRQIRALENGPRYAAAQ